MYKLNLVTLSGVKRRVGYSKNSLAYYRVRPSTIADLIVDTASCNGLFRTRQSGRSGRSGRSRRQMAATKTAMRLAAVQRPFTTASQASKCVRSFTTSALRAKETTSQDDRLNLRHAQRPRLFHTLYEVSFYISLTKASCWEAHRSHRQPSGQVCRQSCGLASVWTVFDVLPPEIYPTVFRVER